MRSPPPPDTAGFAEDYTYGCYCSPKLNAKSFPEFYLFSSLLPPMTPPKSKSLTLSPPIPPLGLVEANFSKPAPKSKPWLSDSYYY